MDWKRKLSSRKLWLAVIAFITSLLMALGAEPDTIERVASIIMSGGALIAYILAEGYIDGKREEGDTVFVDESCDDIVDKNYDDMV